MEVGFSALVGVVFAHYKRARSARDSGAYPLLNAVLSVLETSVSSSCKDTLALERGLSLMCSIEGSGP